jgi:hypothetical protein
MHRPVPLAVVVVLALASAFVGHHPAISAQEGTPNVVVSQQINAQQILFGYLDSVPPTPLSVTFYRVAMPPGAKISGDRGDPGLGLHVVESGTVTATFDGDVPMTRNGQPNGTLRAGQVGHFGPGEGFIWLPPSGGEFRNDRAQPAVIQIVLLYPQKGTPVPGSASATPVS